jgi:hypothetical protein
MKHGTQPLLSTAAVPRANCDSSEAKLRHRLTWCGIGVSFAIAHGSERCFASNQHTYLLHAFRIAHPEALRADWLASTTDLTPLFSYLVGGLLLIPRCVGIYAAYALLSSGFALALICLVAALFPRLRTTAGVTFLGIALTLIDAVPPLRRVLLEGVATQRLLGDYLQPSTFGVCLLGACFYAATNRPRAAVVCAFCAAVLHPTYALSAGLICLGVIVFGPRGEFVRRVVTVLPIAAIGGALLVFELWPFIHGNDPVAIATAGRILALMRLPHHALPVVWFAQRPVAVIAQLAVILVGVFVSFQRNRTLGWLLSSSALISLALTITVMLTDDLQLALFFPWRFSTWLVPVGTALGLGMLIDAALARAPAVHGAVPIRFALVLVVITTVGAGAVHTARSQTTDDHTGLLAAIGAHTDVNDVLIAPPNLEWIRLDTQRAVVADVKSHPYRANEVVNWKSRLELLEAVFDVRLALESRKRTLAQLVSLQTSSSRLLVPASDPLPEYAGLRRLWRGGEWALFAASGR